LDDEQTGVRSEPDATFSGTDARRTSAPFVGTSIRYFGDYELFDVLGQGGMGVVYRARQTTLDRVVALKMIRAGLLAGPDDLQRFQNEVEAVARLDHPGIVPVYEVGEREGQRYFSMKLVDGGNVADRLVSFADNPRAAATLVAEAADAVHHAHVRGILHRDLKPANILIDGEGHPHVTDFGLAKRVGEDDGMTVTGAIIGTPAYMAPEQAAGRGALVTTATDVYGLCAVLYATLTGVNPFKADSVMDTLARVLEQPPDPPSRINHKIPRDLEAICLKGLEKEPRRRYASASELADDLRHWLAGEPVTARTVGRIERTYLWARRKPMLAGLTAALCISLVAGVAGMAVLYRAAVVQRNAAVASEASARQNLQLAEAQASTALTTVQFLVGKVTQDLALIPDAQALRADVLKTSMAQLDGVSKLSEKNTSIEATRAAIYNEMGQLYHSLGEDEKALAQYRLAFGIVSRRMAIQNGSDASRANTAAVLLSISDMELQVDRNFDRALVSIKQSLDLREAILQDSHGNRDGIGRQPRDVAETALAETLTRVGVLHFRAGRNDRAEPYFQRAFEIRQALDREFPGRVAARLDIVRSRLALGTVADRAGQPIEARSQFEQAVKLADAVQAASPGDPNVMSDVYGAHVQYGESLVFAGALSEARPHLEIGERLARASAARFPSDANTQLRLGSVLHMRGGLERLERRPAAATVFAEEVAIRRRLLATDPRSARRRTDLGIALAATGACEEAAGLVAAVAADTRADAELLVDHARAYAQCAGAGTLPGATRGYREQAVAALGRAVAAGYRDRVYVDNNPDFAALRGDPLVRKMFSALPPLPGAAAASGGVQR
jgi:tetratricopeptide (TPR) repeat protein